MSFLVDNLEYTILSGTTNVSVSAPSTLTTPTALSGAIVVPATVTHNGTEYTVTETLLNAFAHGESSRDTLGVTSIVLSEGITKINAFPIRSLNNITFVLPTSINEIPNYFIITSNNSSQHTIVSDWNKRYLLREAFTATNILNQNFIFYNYDQSVDTMPYNNGNYSLSGISTNTVLQKQFFGLFTTDSEYQSLQLKKTRGGRKVTLPSNVANNGIVKLFNNQIKYKVYDTTGAEVVLNNDPGDDFMNTPGINIPNVAVVEASSAAPAEFALLNPLIFGDKADNILTLINNVGGKDHPNQKKSVIDKNNVDEKVPSNIIMTKIIRKELVREIFRGLKHYQKRRKGVRMDVAELGLSDNGSRLGKSFVHVVEPDTEAPVTIDKADVEADELLYVPLSSGDQPVTVNEYGTNNENITFIANGDDTYSAQVNSVATGENYSDGETVEIAGRTFVIGSFTEDGNSGSGSGDPHIVAMNGQVYELPDKVASYRMYQGNNLTINASTRFFTEQEKEAIQQYYLSKSGDVANVYNLVTDGVVQNKVFIKNGDHLITYNFDTNALQSNQEVSYSISKNGVVTINLENATHGKVSVRLTHYANPQVFSGVTVSVQAQSSNHGLLVREYESAHYEIDSLCNTAPVKEGRRATTSARTQLRRN